MKLKDKLRLAFLAAKASRSDEENNEYNALVEACKAAGLSAETVAKEFAPDVEEGTVSSEDLSQLIESAVKKSLPAGSGVDADALLNEIRACKGMDASQVEDIVKKHTGNVSHDGLVAELKKLMPEQGITSKELTAALDSFAKSVRTPARMEYDTTNASFPCEHRLGNLSVAQKQLLNVMVMGTSDEAKELTIKSNGGKALPKNMNDGITQAQLAHAASAGERAIKSLRESIIYGKALTTTSSGSGAELMPSDLSSDLQMRMYVESMLAAEMLASEIQMPTQPFELPLVTTRPSFKLGSEAPGSDPSSSNPGTGVITLNSKKLIGMSEYSYEADEDSIVAILPMVQEQLGAGAADAFENALINGDADGTHMDTGASHASDADVMAFDGFRKLALANTGTKSALTGGITADNVSLLRKLMGKYGLRPTDLMLLVGPNGYNDLVNLDETLTFDKVGSAGAARILTGVAASIFGVRIVVSSRVREDLNASGWYDGTTTTKGSVLLINKSQFLVGSRRGFTVEVDVNRKRQINSVIASFRRAFTPKESVTNATPAVVLGYNYTA